MGTSLYRDGLFFVVIVARCRTRAINAFPFLFCTLANRPVGPFGAICDLKNIRGTFKMMSQIYSANNYPICRMMLLMIGGQATMRGSAELPIGNKHKRVKQQATMETPSESSKRKREDRKEEGQKKINFSNTSNEDDFVQWDALADTKWGRNPLTKYVSVPELDDLVGWATHQQSSVPVVDVNPLLSLPGAPPQPSLLMYLENTVSEILSAQKRSDQWESFDQSALIAIGIALEEMITTNLLPLAQLHVNRCRQLEAIPGNEEKLFSEWTLPPEEAVEKLVEKAKSQQEPEVCLATACPSTRTMIPHAPGTSLLNQPSAERRNKDALLVWCRALGMESAFVKNNMETLSIFLPH
jgi:hypothetical protein